MQRWQRFLKKTHMTYNDNLSTRWWFQRFSKCSSEKLGKMLQFDISVYVSVGLKLNHHVRSTCPKYFPSQKMHPKSHQRIPPSYVNPWRWNAKHGRPTWEWPMWWGACPSWYGNHPVNIQGWKYIQTVVVWDFWTINSRLPHWLFMRYGLMDEDFEGQRWGVKEYETCFLVLELFFECQKKRWRMLLFKFNCQFWHHVLCLSSFVCQI